MMQYQILWRIVMRTTIYDNFRSIMDDGERKLIEQLKQDCELVLLNNRYK